MGRSPTGAVDQSQVRQAPRVLIDLGGTTCYELQQEDAGYSGAFPYQARLDVQVLQKLVQVRTKSGADESVAALSWRWNDGRRRAGRCTGVVVATAGTVYPIRERP